MVLTRRPGPSLKALLGIGGLANSLLSDHPGLRGARDRLNTNYLSNLAFASGALEGQISVSGGDGDL